MLNKDRLNLRKKTSKWFGVITAVVVLGFIVFSTSNLYMEETIEVQASPIGEEISTSGTSDVEVLDWIYDQEKHKMQVVIDMNDLRFEQDSLQFMSKQRSDGEELPVEKTYQMNDYAVVEISQISANYQQVLLQIDQQTEQENNDSATNSASETNTEEVEIMVQLYTDYRKVEEATIPSNDEYSYVKYIMNTLIQDTEETIETKKEERQTLKQEIADLDEEANQIEQEKTYQTDEEQTETDGYLNSLEAEKKQLQGDIDALDEQIKMANQRIDSYEEQKKQESISLQ
ncbi:hypothetical protein CHL76_12035 [Marinococcus halophilus]|uniref:Uncharacterized protein n=1 Tax=Marinococcus halophilus TaxID=1371 RepID=A0A510Y7T7_MARHA|nr:hypothetical protein [Marinococcus halophilus]OZT79635.1 hypothetical protein CHL76_12035 [Marinococcus halophilus]GEK59425.1 hypothetical protein MHA01_23300 [Marinococcus halophilus]